MLNQCTSVPERERNRPRPIRTGPFVKCLKQDVHGSVSASVSDIARCQNLV